MIVSAPAAALPLAMAAAGLLVGFVYFGALRRSAALFAAGGMAAALGLSLARLAAAAALLFAAAQLGAGSLLAAFFGFLAARALALRLARGSR